MSVYGLVGVPRGLKICDVGDDPRINKEMEVLNKFRGASPDDIHDEVFKSEKKKYILQTKYLKLSVD